MVVKLLLAFPQIHFVVHPPRTTTQTNKKHHNHVTSLIKMGAHSKTRTPEFYRNLENNTTIYRYLRTRASAIIARMPSNASSAFGTI